MALRIPSPVALTKPEAYLAYKAGILSRGELKDKLLNPINNYEGWLAKWCELLETYPTNEDGTPQCLTDEEGLLAYLCGVTNRYPASNSNPDDARVSAYIRYLVSARYARPDHPLNREEFYLSLIKTQFIPSGDPSSDIVIDGTTKAPFLDVKVYGDTLQNSYSGKNLISNDGWENVTYNNGASAPSTTRATTGFNPIVGGTYTLTLNGSSNYACIRNIVFFDENQGYLGARQDIGLPAFTATVRSISFTLPGTAKYVRFTFGRYNADSSTADIASVQADKPMCEKGSTATSYEPFVGGIASPNPDYPQEIKTVTGENVVKIAGKNLFSGDYSQFDNQGGTGTLYNYFKLPTDGAYTLKLIAKNDISVQTPQKFLGFTRQGGESAAAVLWAWSGGSSATAGQEFIITNDVYSTYRMVSMSPKNQATLDWFMENFDIQLELGNQATSYEPYQEQDSPIDLGSIELAKIGTYQDRIYKDGEKWYVEKQVGKTTLDGSEEYIWNYNPGTYSGFYRAVDSVLTDGIAKVDDARLSKSNNFTCESTATTWTDAGKFGFSSTWTMWIEMMDNTITTYREFNTWLSTHPTTFYYPLATPTTTEITDQTLIDQLNALKQGGAEEGTTYIKVSATEPNLPAKLYVEAPKYD